LVKRIDQIQLSMRVAIAPLPQDVRRADCPSISCLAWCLIATTLIAAGGRASIIAADAAGTTMPGT